MGFDDSACIAAGGVKVHEVPRSGAYDVYVGWSEADILLGSGTGTATVTSSVPVEIISLFNQDKIVATDTASGGNANLLGAEIDAVECLQ